MSWEEMSGKGRQESERRARVLAQGLGGKVQGVNAAAPP